MSLRRTTQPGWPSAEAAGPELRVGTRLLDGRLTVRGELGCGGMAAAYRAFDRHLGCDVALKVMHRDQADRQARRSRFLAESRMTADLPAHPSVVRWLHDGVLATLGDRPFLCTEQVIGPTLAFHLAVTPRPAIARVVELAWWLADALAAVHHAGIVHRDLTAHNIVLRGYEPAAAPVIIDFGLASRVDVEGPRLTRIDQRPGTITAMAPEQFRGAAPHTAMDVYALGRLLHHLLTGEDPHYRVNPRQLAQMHRTGQRVAVPLAGDGVGDGGRGPEALRRLIDRCLEPSAGLRPSARALRDRLAELRVQCERGATVVALAPRSVADGVAAVALSPRSFPAAVVGLRRRSVLGACAGLLSVAVAIGAVGSRSATSPSTMAAATDARPGVVGEPPPHNEAEREAPVRVRSGALPRARASRASRASVVTSAPPTPPPTAPAVRPPRNRKPRHSLSRKSAPPRCQHVRAAAQQAARAWSWREVLRLTNDRGCWTLDDQRIGLRLTAWVELRRFDACVEEGEATRDRRWARLVERCKRRRELARARGRR